MLYINHVILSNSLTSGQSGRDRVPLSGNPRDTLCINAPSHLMEVSKLPCFQKLQGQGEATLGGPLTAGSWMLRNWGEPWKALATTAAIVMGDKRRLAQVVTNLLENAHKYGGGATVIALKGDRRAVRIAVEDSGPGVPDDEKELVFERFARGTAAGARGSGGGAGLGLALVAEHVRLHNGDVWVGDRLDGAPGARFVVELPRADDGVGS